MPARQPAGRRRYRTQARWKFSVHLVSGRRGKGRQWNRVGGRGAVEGAAPGFSSVSAGPPGTLGACTGGAGGCGGPPALGARATAWSAGSAGSAGRERSPASASRRGWGAGREPVRPGRRKRWRHWTGASRPRLSAVRSRDDGQRQRRPRGRCRRHTWRRAGHRAAASHRRRCARELGAGAGADELDAAGSWSASTRPVQVDGSVVGAYHRPGERVAGVDDVARDGLDDAEVGGQRGRDGPRRDRIVAGSHPWNTTSGWSSELAS